MHNQLCKPIYMSKKRSVTFNHISNEVSKNDIDEMMAYYKTCHRLCYAYKHMFKHYQRLNIVGNVSSAIIGGITVSTVVVTSGIALLAIGSVGIAIQTIMKFKNLSSKIANCKYVYQSYEHLLNQIKESLRLGNVNTELIIKKMSFLEDLRIDLTPPPHKWLKIYDRKYKSP